MSTTKAEAEAILAQIQAVADARIRPMMGEYILYVDGKVVGQINEGKLFIKVSSFGETHAPDLEQQPPYPGAKPAFVVPKAKIDHSAWLRELIAGTIAQLPAKKK